MIDLSVKGGIVRKLDDDAKIFMMTEPQSGPCLSQAKYKLGIKEVNFFFFGQ